jgi:hypothetical protein
MIHPFFDSVEKNREAHKRVLKALSGAKDFLQLLHSKPCIWKRLTRKEGWSDGERNGEENRLAGS